MVDPYDSIKESNEGNNVAYKQVSGVESSIYPIYDYINVDLMHGKIGFNDIKLYVGPNVNSVYIKELDDYFQPDEQGNITLNHLHIYNILANGYNTTTLDFNGEEKKIDLLFSIDHLTDAEKKVFLEKHKDLTGFYQFDSWGGDYVYHDKGIPPSDLIINWSVEGQEIEKYYSRIDEMLRIIQFCILLSCDPDVKDYIESEIKLAKSQEKLTDDCEIYTEILRVLETMDAPMRCDIKIPEIKVVETYNILGEIDIITHTDQFFVDENLSLWITVDNSDNPSDPGGVILHFQTNVFDLDTASGLIKMVIQAEDIAAESMIDIVSIALILSTGGGAAALEPILDQIGTLNDFVGFLAEYERSIISIFWDYTVDLSIPIIQEINPKPISNEENLREVTDALFNNINDVYFPLDSELTVGIARVQKDALESNCVAQPISRILDLGLVFDYTFALHFDSAVNPIEYERVITDLYQDVNTDFVYDWSFEYDIVDPVNPFERNEGSFGDEGTFNYDKKIYYPESILFKVEEFSVSDYIGKNIGAADVVFEYMTKLAAKLVANLIVKNIVIISSADTFAKEVSEAIANELLKSIVKWIVEMVQNFVYETVKNIVADLLLVAIEDLIPADPITTDYYYCFSNTMPFIIPAPSNLFEIDFDNIPITFDQMVSLPLELGSFHIIGSLNVDLDMVEGGTQDDSHLLTIFAREYGEYRRLGSSFTVTTDGPVDIAVKNPDGLIFSKDSGPFSGCIYKEDDLDGEIEDELIIKGGKYGLYEISAIPETGADQNEFFHLAFPQKAILYL